MQYNSWVLDLRTKILVLSTYLLYLVFVLSSCCPVPTVFALEVSFEEMVLISEAANQGFDGMYAVGCVMRNRNWNLEGFSGGRRKDLVSFYHKQPEKVKKWATEALETLHNGGIDTTGGATHMENIGVYGEPYWAKDMTRTVAVGDHQFWRFK